MTDRILAQLINCTKLKKLNLHGCGQISGVAISLLVENLDQLEYLDLSSCTGVTTLGPAFANCRAPLRHLDLSLYDLIDMPDTVRRVLQACYSTLETLIVAWGTVYVDNDRISLGNSMDLPDTST